MSITTAALLQSESSALVCLKAIYAHAENEKEKKKIDCMSSIISFVTNCI